WRDNGKSSPPDGMTTVVSALRFRRRPAHSSAQRPKSKSPRRKSLTSRIVFSLQPPEAFVTAAILGPVPGSGKHGAIAFSRAATICQYVTNTENKVLLNESWGGLRELCWNPVSHLCQPIQFLNQSAGEFVTYQDRVEERRVRRASP